MSRKRKSLTPFARLLIFLLFLTPIAYIGASYYKGQDGFQNVKNLVGLGEKTDKQDKGYMRGNKKDNEEVLDAYKQIEDLKRRLRDKDATIKSLQDELQMLKSTEAPN